MSGRHAGACADRQRAALSVIPGHAGPVRVSAHACVEKTGGHRLVLWPRRRCDPRTPAEVWMRWWRPCAGRVRASGLFRRRHSSIRLSKGQLSSHTERAFQHRSADLSDSLVEDGEAAYFLARSGDEKRLCVIAPAGSMALGTFARTSEHQGKRRCWFAVRPMQHGRVPRHAAVAAPGPVGAAHVGRLWRSIGLATPATSGSALGGRRHRDDLRAAVDPRDDPHRPPADDVIDDATWASSRRTGARG